MVLTSFSLIVVIAMIFGVAWLYNKLRNVDPSSLLAGKFTENPSNKFHILSTATLGQGKNIHLVEINGKQLVIGSTMNNISLLTELKDAAEQNATTMQSTEDSEPIDQNNYESGFNEIYKEYLKDNPKKSNNDDADEK